MDISEAELTRLLPTCQRCRRLRRKCDTQLPACRLCQKGKAECTFFDHALQQTLPRSYVHSLLSRLGRLRAVRATIEHGPQDTNAAPRPTDNYVENVRTTSAASNETNQQHSHKQWPQMVRQSFDKHFILENANPTCWQFFGSSSSYALAVEVLVVARTQFGPLTHPENYAGPQFKLKMVVPELTERKEFRPCPPRAEIEMLVNLYMSSTNISNPHVDHAQILAEIDVYLRYQNTSAKYLVGIEAHQFFRIAMICAIAAANKSRHHPAYINESFNYYIEALPCAQEVTSDISIDALQALLLLLLYTFFFPNRGDVWKLLDYACRLSVELNMHTETEDEFEKADQKERRRSIFWSLYSLERTFGQHLGRPSDLPEEIITAAYPANMDTESVSRSFVQDMLIGHYYRLIYIRSEIFRILYMPAITPDLPHSWYEDRFEEFLEWNMESDALVAQPNHVYDMGTMQCEMGFNTSLNFLFQPLLLRALAAIKDPNVITNPAPDLAIPRESWDAAVHNVSFYDRLFRASEGSPEGDYPITIVSAHYIHQSTMTIMAHVLLAIDARLPLVSFSRNLEGLSRTIDSDGNIHTEVPPIDFSNIYNISNVCLYLLHQLADRWAGMVGILDLYREMHHKVLPALAERR